MNIGIEKFGKDHFSLLGYLETLQVDSADEYGHIDRRRMRCNEKTHPLLVDAYRSDVGWRDSYGTRLKKGVLSGHDDWDCLDDLDVLGWVEVISSVNGIFKLTEKGMKVAGELRKHKANGGTFSTFEYREEV